MRSIVHLKYLNYDWKQPFEVMSAYSCKEKTA